MYFHAHLQLVGADGGRRRRCPPAGRRGSPTIASMTCSYVAGDLAHRPVRPEHQPRRPEQLDRGLHERAQVGDASTGPSRPARPARTASRPRAAVPRSRRRPAAATRAARPRRPATRGLPRWSSTNRASGSRVERADHRRQLIGAHHELVHQARVGHGCAARRARRRDPDDPPGTPGPDRGCRRAGCRRRRYRCAASVSASAGSVSDAQPTTPSDLRRRCGERQELGGLGVVATAGLDEHGPVDAGRGEVSAQVVERVVAADRRPATESASQA